MPPTKRRRASARALFADLRARDRRVASAVLVILRHAVATPGSGLLAAITQLVDFAHGEAVPS